MSIQQGKVKSVSSGDTLVLTPLNNGRLERTLCLAYVTAPRMRREGDEPYAFQSRDLLRRLIVGKVVQFEVIYKVRLPSSGQSREYAIFTLQGGESLPHLSLSEGLVKLRNDASKNAESESQQKILAKLEQEEAQAKADSKGLWAAKVVKIDTIHEIPDPKAFVDDWKDRLISGIVEHVLTGDRMIVRLMIKPEEHVQILVLVAGIRAPNTKRTNTSDGKEVDGEPHGEEARLFVEDRLLQRNVSVQVFGVSPQGQLVCAVKHPNGSIAEFILREGLARCVDHHTTMLGGDMAKLREAEKHAKTKKLGIFQGHVSTKTSDGDTDVTVIKVDTADTIHVRTRDGKDMVVSLSSIRAPKRTDPNQEPFQPEAKEFLRRLLIGKHVRLTIDGKRPASEAREERDVATIILNKQNVALQLVGQGYASVIRHRRDDDDRSPIYDDLRAEEEVALKEKKGMWSDKPPATKKYVDYSESLQKAKIQASVLQRQNKIPAIVDFVKGASRFTLLVPRENAKLTLVLSCIRAPRSARPNSTEASEPFGKEAHEFATRKCQQRDVEVVVEDVDKVGAFIGTLYVNRENFSKLLLEEGLAQVHAYSAEKSSQGPELFAAEQRAKDARKGMWHDYQPSVEDVDEKLSMSAPTTNGTTANGTSAAPQPAVLDYKNVMITHVDPTTLHLKFQLIGNATTGALEEMMTKFRAFHTSPTNNKPLQNPPRQGDYVAAKFSEDGEWYRARIRRKDGAAKTAEVLYIDYGNDESLPWSALRPLAANFSVQTFKPQAQDAVLAYLQWPTAKEYVADAFSYLNEHVNGQKMVSRVEYVDVKDNGTMYVVLYPQTDEVEVTENVNVDVVAEGLAVVKRALKGWEKNAEEKLITALKEKEEKARNERLGGWEYGDFGGDEEESLRG